MGSGVSKVPGVHYSVLRGEGAEGPSACRRGLACVLTLGFHLVTLAQLLHALQKGLPGLRHALLQKPALTLTLGVLGVGNAFQRRVQVAQPNSDGHLVWGEETYRSGEVVGAGVTQKPRGPCRQGSAGSELMRACPSRA